MTRARGVNIPQSLACALCGREFTARRPTARYCGPSCRQLAWVRAHQGDDPRPVEAKRCSTCGLVLPTIRFSLRRASSDRLQASCRACANTASAKWRESQP